MNYSLTGMECPYAFFHCNISIPYSSYSVTVKNDSSRFRIIEYIDSGANVAIIILNAKSF